MAAAPSPHLWAFLSPAEPLPAFTAAPADAAARDRILLLAKYAMQNGTSFVDMVRTNQGSNPEYAFLTPGGTDHGFFRWALFATGCGLPVEQPPPLGFVPPAPQPYQQQAQQQQQQQQPPVQAMPPQPQQPQQYLPPHQPPAYGVPPQQQYAHPGQYQQPHGVQVQVQQPQPPPARPQPPHIPPDFAAGFSQVLDNLSGSKDSIKASQGWFMACAAYAAGLAYMMASRAASLQDFDKLLHLIYLANEILFKAMQQAQGIAKQEEGQQHLEPAAAASVTAAFVPAVGVIMAAAYGVAQAAGNTEGSGKLDKMLSFWRDKGVFDPTTIARFQHEMQGGNAAALLLANYPPAQQPQPPQPTPPPPLQQPQQPQPGWGPAGTPMQPQAPVSGGWAGAPSPHMPAAAQPGGAWGPPAAFQPQQPFPQQAAPGGWGQPQPPPPQPPPPAAPWAARAPPAGTFPPAAVQPPFPGAVPPGQYPGAVPQGFSGGVGVVPSLGQGVRVVPAQAVAQPGAEPQPEPASSMAFPPGLLPTLCREKSKYSEPYAAIEPHEIDRAGLPLPPEKDAYLKSRMDKFLLELRDYKAGSCRADLEESRAAARAQQGLEPDSDEELALGSTGSRLARRKALGMGSAGFEGRRRRRNLGPVVGGMAEDGTYVGPGGARGERLGLGAHSATDTVAELGDVYSSYRKMRSTSYHQMIVEGAAGPPGPA